MLDVCLLRPIPRVNTLLMFHTAGRHPPLRPPHVSLRISHQILIERRILLMCDIQCKNSIYRQVRSSMDLGNNSEHSSKMVIPILAFPRLHMSKYLLYMTVFDHQRDLRPTHRYLESRRRHGVRASLQMCSLLLQFGRIWAIRESSRRGGVRGGLRESITPGNRRAWRIAGILHHFRLQPT
jgi:hypothetical protein